MKYRNCKRKRKKEKERIMKCENRQDKEKEENNKLSTNFQGECQCKIFGFRNFYDLSG